MEFKHVPARFLLAACNLTLVLNQMFVYPYVNWCITFYLFLFSYRLFGLVGIIYTDCSAPLALHVRPYLDWPQCASPGVILALYWLLATETRYYFIHVSDMVFVWNVILELYFWIENFEFSFLWHFYILIRNYLQMYPGDNTSLGCQDVGHCCQHSFLRAILIRMTIWQHNQLLLWSSNHFQYCTSTSFFVMS